MKPEKYKPASVKAILNRIEKLIGPDHKPQTPVSKDSDGLEAISLRLTELTRTLESREEKLNSDKKRLAQLMDLLLDYAVADFSKKATLSGNGDEIDALSAGLNALGEELEYSFETQKKYAEELRFSNHLLTENKEKIQALFDNAPDAIIAVDSAFRITEWNSAAELMYGFKRSEVIGKRASEIITSEHPFPFSSKQATLQLNGAGIWSGELIQSTSRKEKMIVHNSTSILKDVHGNAIGYLGVNRDLTQLRKTKEELRESETRYYLLVNEIVDYAIIMLDPSGTILSWNKGAKKIKGYNEQEVIGKNFSMFYTDDEKKEHVPEKILDEARKNGKYNGTGWRIRKDKSRFWADVTITKLTDSNEELKGFVKITRDLSERRRVEEEIIQKSEELERSNTELEQFAYVASHDLQEPLRMITSYVQLLEKHYKDKLDQDAHDFINFAVDGARRMQTLIYSLLEYSRINRVKPFEHIDLDDTLDEVIKDLELSINDSHAKITWDKLPVIYGDKILIGQLFLNLIANAIKFRRQAPPEIHISCKKKNNFYHFSVSDNGIGIKKEYCEKIFIIFQRLHSKDKYPGTGIGLAICKKIVERHGGTIWVESDLNKGSVFQFTIKIN